MVYIYFIVMAVLLVASFRINKKDFISPAFIFTFGFFFQAIWVVLYARKWQFNMHMNTMLTLIIGVITFILVTSGVQYLLNKKTKKLEEQGITAIKIENWKLYTFLAFTLLFTIYYLSFVVKSVDGNIFNIKSIMDSIAKFDQINKFSNDFIKVPFLLGNIRIALMACGYWLIYVLVNNYLCEKKVNIVIAISVVVTLILSILNGSRTPAIFMLGAGVAYYLLLLFKKSNGVSISSKLIRNIAIIGLVVLLTFSTFAKLMGRNIKEKPLDYLAIYCGAQVHNLDTFLQEKDTYVKQNEYFGGQTFYSIVTSVGRKVSFDGYKDYKLDLPFRRTGEYSLGNVYTTFYPYVYDFGYVGCVILVALMATISQAIYHFATRANKKGTASIAVLAYGVVFACLLLSFFSNKFYENITNTDFLKKIVIWYLCGWFFCKFDLVKTKNAIKKRFEKMKTN